MGNGHVARNERAVRILLHSPDLSMGKVFALVCEEEEFACTAFPSFGELEAAARNCGDLVLLDFTGGPRDLTAEQAEALDRVAHAIPTIVLTNPVWGLPPSTAVELGVAVVLCTPLELDALATQLRRLARPRVPRT